MTEDRSDLLAKWLETWKESDEEIAAREKKRLEMLRDKKRARTRGRDSDAGGTILLKPQQYLVCVCGHTLDSHEVLNNNGANAQCWVNTTTPCHCVMHAQPIVKITKQSAKFKRQARGGDRPHSFTGAINAALASGGEVEWLKTTCDRCGNEFDKDANGQYQPHVYVLDLNDQIQRPGKEQPIGSILSSRDTGKHIMLCASCDKQDQDDTDYHGTDRKLVG